MGNLTEHFDRAEFACGCGCGTDNVSRLLVTRLQAMRELLGRPIVVSSGCRCREHNRAEGGKPDSAHLSSRLEFGEAADLAAPTGGDRYALVKAALAAGITRIGIGASFVHVDVDGGKEREVLWTY